MVYLKKIWYGILYLLTLVWEFITWPYRRITDEMRYRKRLKELRKRDTFIYK